MSKYGNYNEKELVNGVKRGDKAAFEEAYDRYSPALYGVVLKILQDEAQAQDVLQDAFVKIWKKIHSYDDTKGRFFTWLLNLTRNTAIDAYRKNQRKPKDKIQVLDHNVNIEDGHQTKQNVDAIGIHKVIDQLPDEQKILIEYLYFKGYTQKETAEELDVPLGTVKSRIRMAVQSLRKVLKT